LLGVGFLAIPTLSGSAAYAFAETFGWRQGLDQKLFKARSFYSVVVLATVLGIALDFARVNPMRALFFSAVINGVLAPVLLVGIFLVAIDARVMLGQTSSKIGRVALVATFALMLLAAVGMFVM
jgi:Mn2+/Fe2+ NRAMP family transporter